MAAKSNQESAQRDAASDPIRSEPGRSSRREFTLGALGGVATVLLAGCSEDRRSGAPDASHDAGRDPRDDGGQHHGEHDAGSDGEYGDHDDGGKEGSSRDGGSERDASAERDASTDAGGDGVDPAEDAGSDSGTPNQEPISCEVRPQQTEGPYFVDEGLARADIRAEPPGSSTRVEGVELRLKIGVYGLDGNSCKSIEGAVVDIWQCDALGVYSDVEDTNGLFDTRGQKFLRGFQRTDEHGVVEFVTIYPGWYSGRSVHIHFMVRTNPESTSGLKFTSQLYFEDSVTDEVANLTPYRNNQQRPEDRVRNARDGIFAADSGDQLIVQVEKSGAGYTGKFGLGLRLG